MAVLAAPSLHAELASSPGVSVTPSPLAQLRQAGSGRYTYWGFDVYQASLWTPAGFDAADLERQRFALELHYLRAFKGADIARRSIDEMRRIGSLSEAQARDWLQAMQRVFPDVAAGDRLTGVHLPGRGARFYANGQLTGEVADPEFARMFFGIWLSAQTTEPKLRQALLAQSVAGAQR